MNADFLRIIATPPADRRGLFLVTANRLGTPIQNVARHVLMFFNSADLDLLHARPGSFAIAPTPGMVDALRRLPGDGRDDFW